MLNEYVNDIQELMMELDFPEDAQKTFLDALSRISADANASKRFMVIQKQYVESEFCNYPQMLADVKEIGQALNIHEYTISMLMYICMAKTLRQRYRQRNLPDSIFCNSMMDLRYKLEECRLVCGVNGSFVAHWFYRFFNLTRFALGRLQFELTETKADYTIGERIIPAGMKAINVHIPRTGTKLDHREVMAAYAMAEEFFAAEFDGGFVLFTCYSWLLDPWNFTVLSPESNLAAFCGDYKIVETGNYEGYGEMWRLFDCLCTGNLSQLPRNSTLRRAYAARMERGEPIGWGRGLFIYRNNKIYNN